MYSTALLTNLLAYPFLTVQRRLECRSAQATSLFPNDAYKSGRFTACLSQIIKEEGARTLWRGFAAHMLTVVIFLSALPTATDFLMQRMPKSISEMSPMGSKQPQQQVLPAGRPSEEEWYEQDEASGAGPQGADA